MTEELAKRLVHRCFPDLPLHELVAKVGEGDAATVRHGTLDVFLVERGCPVETGGAFDVFLVREDVCTFPNVKAEPFAVVRPGLEIYALRSSDEFRAFAASVTWTNPKVMAEVVATYRGFKETGHGHTVLWDSSSIDAIVEEIPNKYRRFVPHLHPFGTRETDDKRLVLEFWTYGLVVPPSGSHLAYSFHQWRIELAPGGRLHWSHQRAPEFVRL